MRVLQYLYASALKVSFNSPRDISNNKKERKKKKKRMQFFQHLLADDSDMDSSVVKACEEKHTEGSDDHSVGAAGFDKTDVGNTISTREKFTRSEIDDDPYGSGAGDTIEEEKNPARGSSGGEQRKWFTDLSAEGLPTISLPTVKEHNEESTLEASSSSPLPLPPLISVFPRCSSQASHSPSSSSRADSSSSGGNSTPVCTSSHHYFKKAETPASHATSTPITYASSAVLPSDAGQDNIPFLDRCPPLPSNFQTIPTKDRRESSFSSVITAEDKSVDTGITNGQTKANLFARLNSTRGDEEVEELQSGESPGVSKALSESILTSPSIAFPHEKDPQKECQGSMTAPKTDGTTLQSNALQPPLTLPSPPPIPSDLSSVAKSGPIPPPSTSRKEIKKGWFCCFRSNFIKHPSSPPLSSLLSESSKPILSIAKEEVLSPGLLEKNANDSTGQLLVLPLTSPCPPKGESALTALRHPKEDLFHATPDEKTSECHTVSSLRAEEGREELGRVDTDTVISPVLPVKEKENEIEAVQLEQPGTPFSISATPESHEEHGYLHDSIHLSSRTGHAACSECDLENIVKGSVDKGDEFLVHHRRFNCASESGCSSVGADSLNRSARSSSTPFDPSTKLCAHEFASVRSNATSANVSWSENDSTCVSSSGGSTNTQTETTLSRSSVSMNSRKPTHCSLSVTPLPLNSNERPQATPPYSVSHPGRIFLPYRSSYYEDKWIESATRNTFSARSITSFPTRSTHSTRKSGTHDTLLTPFHSAVEKLKRSPPPNRSGVAQHQCCWNKATATSFASSGGSFCFGSLYSLPLSCRCHSRLTSSDEKKNTTRKGTSSVLQCRHIGRHLLSGGDTPVFTPPVTPKDHRNEGKTLRAISEVVPEKVFPSFFPGSPSVNSAHGSGSGVSPSDLRTGNRLLCGVSRSIVHQDGGAVAPLSSPLPSLCSFEHCPLRDPFFSSSFGSPVDYVPSRKNTKDVHQRVCKELLTKKKSGLQQGEFLYIPPRPFSSPFHSASGTVKSVKADKNSFHPSRSPYRAVIGRLSPVFSAVGRTEYPFEEECLDYDLDTTLLSYEKASKATFKVPSLQRACQYMKSARSSLLKSRLVPSVSLGSSNKIDLVGRDATMSQKRHKSENDMGRSMKPSSHCSCRRRKSTSRSPFACVVRQPHMVGC